jgi:hypothetical protein
VDARLYTLVLIYDAFSAKRIVPVGMVNQAITLFTTRVRSFIEWAHIEHLNEET